MVAVTTDPKVRAGGYVTVEGTIVGSVPNAGRFAGTDVTVVLIEGTSVEPTNSPAKAPE
jgi:hypothetical protein